MEEKLGKVQALVVEFSEDCAAIKAKRGDGEYSETVDSWVVLPATGYPLHELEKSAVRQALELSGGNQTRAAELLHIPRHILLYRLEKFGLKSS